MMMDVQTALLGVAVFVVSCGILIFISVFGIKQKSYEEALAEQRQQTNALLGTHSRPKLKEKKQKKVGKKVKEKQISATVECEVTEESENTEIPSSESTSSVGTSDNSSKHHVEFKEPTVIEETVKEHVKKRVKKDKVRPILVNKDMSEEVVVVDEVFETPPANHFEQLHPKDDLELLHCHIKDEQVTKQQEPAKEKVKAKQVTEEARNNKKAKHQLNEVVAQTVTSKEDVVPEPIVAVPQTNGYVPNPGKDKKKKKSELNTIQQLTGDKQGVNLAILTTLVRKAELSRSEVQILIDMLLNKQHEAPAVLDEWSEGKADPVQKLKKQLADKEKLLVEEQEALISAQAKLKEVRAELNAERSHLLQRVRALEENLQAKQLEIQASTNHAHTVTQKTQCLIEELQRQRQQLEMHMGQTQEAEGTIVQLRNELQELQARSNQLTNELIAINEQKDLHQNTSGQLQHQLAHFKKELDQKDEIVRQMEESRDELEHRLSVSHRQENELKAEISQLKSTCQQHIEEIRRLELNKSQSLGEMQNFQKQKEEYEKTISQLNQELIQAQEETLQLEASRENGLLEESKTHQIEIMNLHNELSSIKSELQQSEKNHALELDLAVKKYRAELDEQRDKNNELRKKNWKVMEALNAAESRNSSSSSKPTISTDATITKIRQEEQHLNRKLLQRLFPEVRLSDNLPQDQWISNVEAAVHTYVSGLKRPKTPEPVDNSEVVKLQAQVSNYKSIIDDIEGTLNKLQMRTEQEEIKWRNEIKSKEDEIKALKEQHIAQLQTQLTAVQSQLDVELAAKQKLHDDCQRLKSKTSPQGDTIAQIERLSEEVNRLTGQLQSEQKRNVDLQSQVEEIKNVSAKDQNHTSSNGPTVAIENSSN